MQFPQINNKVMLTNFENYNRNHSQRIILLLQVRKYYITSLGQQRELQFELQKCIFGLHQRILVKLANDQNNVFYLDASSSKMKMKSSFNSLKSQRRGQNYVLILGPEQQNLMQNVIFNAITYKRLLQNHTIAMEVTTNLQAKLSFGLKTIFEERVEEITFISQFLSFSTQNIQAGTEQGRSSNSSLSEQKQEGCEPSPFDQNRTSAFHNFQKHLIVTLKKEIKLRKIRDIKNSQLKTAYQLWEMFVSSEKSTKKSLYTILFTSEINNDPQFKKTPNSDIQIKIFINQLSDQLLRKAQQYLKKLLIKQCSRLLQGNFLKGRRIHRSEQFKKYFENFIVQLSTGAFSKRSIKQKSNCYSTNTQFLKING